MVVAAVRFFFLCSFFAVRRIYFDKATTRQRVERFYSALLAGGWLIVVPAKPRASANPQLELNSFPQTVVYRKRLDAPVFSWLVTENQL
jgi:hypothetical protein